MEDLPTVVIDNGSYLIKTGFGGGSHPRAIFPTLIGTRRPEATTLPGLSLMDMYIGDAAFSRRNQRMLHLRRPIERGIVSNWEDMEKIWHHTFYNEIRIPPAEAVALLTEPPLNPKPNREKMAQIMFETFLTPATCIVNQAVPALYDSSMTTGVVLDSGFGVTRAIPVYEGHALPHAVTQLDLGGQDLTNYLVKIMDGCGNSLELVEDPEVANEIKAKFCYVAPDFNQELEFSANSSNLEKTYELLNGKTIQIHTQQFRCTEAMFQPPLLGLEAPGIHELIHNAISKCDPDLQTEMYKNVVLSGGNTMFTGMADRLEKELARIAPSETKVRIVSPRTRKWSAWNGGSALANSNQFQQMWMTDEDYKEIGPNIVHRMCF